MSEADLSPLRAWLLAARPRTLPAAAAPVVVGSALAAADGAFRPAAALAALLAALLIQVGTNLANDLGDFRRGADTPDRLGPTRVTSAGLLTPRAVAFGTWASFMAAAFLGLYLVTLGGIPVLLIGLGSIAAGVAYTAGPYPLGYNGLGDLFVFVFFGIVAVVGTYYVQALEAPAAIYLASLPIGALATAILVVNNTRDIDTDRAAGKQTLAVRLGRDGSRREYVLLLALAYGLPFVLFRRYGPGAFLPLLTVPLALGLARVVRERTDGPALNAALAGTARLLLLYSLLFALGVLLPLGR